MLARPIQVIHRRVLANPSPPVRSWEEAGLVLRDVDSNGGDAAGCHLTGDHTCQGLVTWQTDHQPHPARSRTKEVQHHSPAHHTQKTPEQ